MPAIEVNIKKKKLLKQMPNIDWVGPLHVFNQIVIVSLNTYLYTAENLTQI